MISSLRPGHGIAGELPALDSGRKKVLAAFLKSAHLRFKSLELLNLSLTHRSVANESGSRSNNERLEFLGDSILGAVTASLLYKKLHDKNEGELAKIKSVVVSEEILSGLALELRIDSALVLGKGEEHTGGRTKKAILADALEAVTGALYLDSGYRAAQEFIGPRMEREINRVLENRGAKDYKSLLQEFTQRRFRAYPAYKLVKRTGPEHEKMFWVEVRVDGKNYGPCTGRNKKAAEQEAARMAYESLSTCNGSG